MSGRRICVTAPQVPYIRGGAELHAELLAAALAAAGHQVEIVSLPYVWVPTRSGIEQALAWRLVNLVDPPLGPGSEIELVISTKYPSYLVRHPNKVAWIFHQQREVYDLYATEYSPFSLSDEHRGVRQAVVDLDLQALTECRNLFTNSQNVADRLERYTGLTATALYAPPKLYRDLHPGRFGDYIAFVGRLDPIKRVDLTIRALARTKKNVKLKVAGRGPHRPALEALVEELGLQGRVEFLGFVTDEEVIDLYAGCFAVALTPHDEDYGFTTLEAYFAGKPVLTTTDAGGVLEFVEDGVNGFVLEPEASAIAQRIDRLFDDRGLGETMGMAGLEVVREKASWDRAIAALTETLD